MQHFRLRKRSGSHRWFAWALAWTALMVVILLIGTAEWRDSIFYLVVPVFGSIFGNSLIGYRARRGYWPWTPDARRFEGITR